ncbi:MAG: DUF4174 domain-containing protein [Gammaproteobacteria bacterium]|nr:DUF4174 domain-containing protein [Gammaproteobacteria bacterium]
MTRRLFPVLLCILVMHPVHADLLEGFQWQSRLLVLAAPSADDPALRQQREVIAKRDDAFIDRDLRVIELYGDRGLLDGQPISNADLAGLRARFRLAADDRVMILVGLDGGEKRRSSLTTPLSEVFLQIDGMPMRRAEIRARRAAGEPVTPP